MVQTLAVTNTHCRRKTSIPLIKVLLMSDNIVLNTNSMLVHESLLDKESSKIFEDVLLEDIPSRPS